MKLINRKTVIPLVLIITVIATAIVVRHWGFIKHNCLGIIGVTVPIIIGLMTLSIKYPKIYMYLVYIKAVLFGENTLWNLCANYSGKITDATFDNLCLELEKISSNPRVIYADKNYYEANLEGINVRLKKEDIFLDDLESDDDYYQKLNFQITDFRAPYEDTLNLLEGIIVPYLSKIHQVLAPQKSDFELTINFFKGNPWAKAVTKGINYDDILSMDFEVKIHDGKKAHGNMKIGKKDLRISCSELAFLIQLIRKRLMLGW